MELSVVVPVANDPRLARCLEGLFQQTLAPASYEVLVVDNGPSEEMRRLVQAFPAGYLVQPNGGSYAARNLGIKEARGKVLAFTDADCVPPPQWLSVIQSVFDNGACDVAVGPSYVLNSDKVGRLVQMVDDERWARLAQEGWVAYCDTRNLAGRRQTFVQRPFDSAFRHGGDLEWGIRAVKRKHRIFFVPEMAVGHENVSALPAVYRRGVQRGRALAAIHRKHGKNVRISGARHLTVMGIDLKDRIMGGVASPVLRPLALVGLGAGTALLMALLEGLLWAGYPVGGMRRPFRIFDRASLLLGYALGP